MSGAHFVNIRLVNKGNSSIPLFEIHKLIEEKTTSG